MRETGRRLADFFSNDSIFGRIFGTAGDIILINLLFLISSVPILTIGASLSAMNHTFLEKKKGSDEAVPRLFFAGFKKNLKQGTAAWLLLLILGIVLATDLHTFGPNGPLTSFPAYIVSAVLLVLVLMASIWLFALIPSTGLPLLKLIPKAFLLAAVNFPYTLLLTAALAGSVMLTFRNFFTLFVGISVWIFFGFGLYGYLAGPLLLKGMEKWKNILM